MARKDARNYTAPTTKTIGCYHGRRFNELNFYNSDRKIKLNPDYTVSSDNTRSALTIAKAGSHVKAFGLEIENVGDNLKRAGMDTYVNVIDLIFNKAGFDPDFFKVERDCTVDAECITQTFSKAWLRNNYKSFKAMWELFETFGITTNDTRCGMHVNVDLSNFGNNFETATENARKLGYVIQRHYNLMKVCFNRGGETTYCQQMSPNKEYWKTTALESFSGSHGISYNMSHVFENRVEIRLVGGQKNYACFRNTMETVFHLIDRVNKLGWSDLDDVEKLFTGCNNYVFDRLSTNCLERGVITADVVNAIRTTIKNERFL